MNWTIGNNRQNESEECHAPLLFFRLLFSYLHLLTPVSLYALSIDFKKTMVSPLTANFELYRAETFRTTPFISSSFFVNVNPHVNAAAVKSYTDKLSPFRFFRRRGHFRFRRRIRITGNVKHWDILPQMPEVVESINSKGKLSD